MVSKSVGSILLFCLLAGCDVNTQEAIPISLAELTFEPESETLTTNAFRFSMKGQAVRGLTFLEDGARYRLRWDHISSGQATVLKHTQKPEGTLAFMVGNGKAREEVSCTGSGMLYGELPTSIVIFHLILKDGVLSCARTEPLPGDENALAKVAFVPVEEGWLKNVFEIGYRGPGGIGLSYSPERVGYPLPHDIEWGIITGQAAFLKRWLRKPYFAFVVGSDQRGQRVQCDAGDLYSDLPTSPVIFRLTQINGNLSCDRVEDEVP